MAKGIPNKSYIGEFRQKVAETKHQGKLGYVETEELFGIRHKCVEDWERICLGYKARKDCMWSSEVEATKAGH